MKSDNVFCVGFSFSSFPDFRRAFTSSIGPTHSQFYTRDARTLTAAARLTPKIAEKTNKALKYYFIRYSTRVSIHGCSTDIGRRRRQGLGRGSASVRHGSPCGISCGKGDPLASSERLSMGSARATTLPRRGAQLLTT